MLYREKSHEFYDVYIITNIILKTALDDLRLRQNSRQKSNFNPIYNFTCTHGFKSLYIKMG